MTPRSAGTTPEDRREAQRSDQRNIGARRRRYDRRVLPAGWIKVQSCVSTAHGNTGWACYRDGSTSTPQRHLTNSEDIDLHFGSHVGAPMATPPIRYTSLKEFYPFYLSEHQNRVSRLLHFVGTSLIGLWITLAVLQKNAWWLVLIPVGGYGFAWVGHYFFEKNRPATFQYPLYSLASDFILWWHTLTGKGSSRTSK